MTLNNVLGGGYLCYFNRELVLCPYLQVVITSDGKLHKLPADISQELVNAYIDSYEDILEMRRKLQELDSLRTHKEC